MKKIYLKLTIVAFAFTTLIMAISCSDWLDVKPKTEMDAGEMFSSEEGFKGALAGVYTAMTQPSLYGRELTYGMADVVAQQWKISSNHRYSDAVKYEYESVRTKGAIDNIWNDMYNAIANANSILEYIDNPEVRFTGDNRRIIKGEALAIRAYLHLDLLRYFGGEPNSTSVEDGIPYVDKLSKRIVASISPKDVISKIMIDLKEAQEYLKDDPILTGEEITTDLDDGYLLNRNYHLNYYAVVGLMARTNLYARNINEAKDYAETVIRAHETKGVFPWSKSDEVINPKRELRDRTFSSEHLFALNIKKLTTYIEGYFMSTDNPLLTRQSVATLFGTTEDYRKNFFETMNYVGEVPSKLWQMNGVVVNGVLSMPKRDRMPMMRLSEMYYIAAESNVTNPTVAAQYINQVLLHRGYIESELLDTASVDATAIRNALLSEYRREFIAEGQLFFYYKRNKVDKIGDYTPNYVFPKPETELEFGQ